MINKFKIWHIDGYTGSSDYDGPSDCNHHENLIFDASYTKKEVIKMWLAIHNYGRENVVSKCECIGEGVYETETTENISIK